MSVLVGRERIPFYRWRGWHYKLERKRERERVRVLPSRVAHAIGYETIISAHNTAHAQMHLTGFTVFAWYGKCRRLQYLKTNVDVHNIVWVRTPTLSALPDPWVLTEQASSVDRS